MIIEASILPGSAANIANRKQYISLGHDLKTGTQNILCGVPPDSILGPLLFLLYVNDLPNSPVFDPIMFPHDTNLFLDHTNLRTLFSTVNEYYFPLSMKN